MSILDFLLAVPVWFLNGLLAILYWLASHLPEGISLLCGLMIAFGIDLQLQKRASERPRRYGRGELNTSPPNAVLFTLATLLAWLVASALSEFPVPWIGAGLWLAALIGILAVSEERFNQAWWAKTGLLSYALLALLLRFGLQALQSASPADWAAVVGSSLDAQSVLAHTRSTVATIGMLFVLVLYPLGFSAMLFQRFLRNPKPLFNLWREAGDVLKRLRTRM